MKFLFFIALLITAPVAFAQELKEVKLPAGFTAQKDVVYKSVGGWDGRVDLYLPPNTGKLTPVVVHMHGGAWRHGNKESQTGFQHFFLGGMAVANVAYRLAHEASAPAAVEDVRCAIMYLVNNARALNIDPNLIILSGSSAGAHLALVAGMVGEQSEFDKDCTPAKGFKIAAIIAHSAPSVLYQNNAQGQPVPGNDGAIQVWFGARKNDVELAKKLSPITYVNKQTPPIFLTHGDADMRVAYQQAVMLDAKLTEAGVPHTFIAIEGGGHGGYTKEKQEELKMALFQFYKQHVSKQ